MIHRLVISLFLFSDLLLSAQQGPEKAPADPDFYLSPAELQSMSESGIILPPIRPLHDPWKNFQAEPLRNFPAVYDMRNTSWLTPVKSQSAGGCWAYSIMGALESRLLMLGHEEFDLSDNHLQNCHKYLPERSGNGNHWMATAFFARRSGPILQHQYAYPGGQAYYNCCPDDTDALFYVHQARYPPADNMAAIKQTVMDYGPVWSLLYWNDSFYNPGNYTYYYNGTANVNHAGCVIGWDDNKMTARGTGAWIVRNTWGSNWGEGGYYYIAYDDSRFLKYNGYWPEVMENEANTTIFQHDEIGGYWGSGGWNQYAYGLVKFDGPESDMRITRIGTFMLYANCGIEIKVYSQFSDSLSGLLYTGNEETVPLPGYYTFDLDSTILIPAGQDFYVQVKYDSKDSLLKWPVPVEDSIAGYAKPTISTGKYWLAPDPGIWPTAWYPLGHGTPYGYDLCIKAYTKKIMVPEVVTGFVSNAGADIAEISGNVILSQGESPVSVRGICWNISGNPTLENNTGFTIDAGGSGTYTGTMTGLQPQTRYYLRAYASNNTGTGYGDVIEFTTGIANNLVLSDLNLATGTDTCFSAIQTIRVAGNENEVVVNTGAFIELISGYNILLQYGTSVEEGGNLIARISEDGAYCSKEKALIVVEQEEIQPILYSTKPKELSPCFRVYPNPTTGRFALEQLYAEEKQPVTIEIFGMQLYRIFQAEIPGTSVHHFDLSRKPAGVYLIRIIRGTEISTVKLVKTDN